MEENQGLNVEPTIEVKSKKGKVITGVVIATIIISLLTMMSINSNNKKYAKDLELTYASILDTGSKAEAICNTYHKVWGTAINSKHYSNKDIANDLGISELTAQTYNPMGAYLKTVESFDDALTIARKAFKENGKTEELNKAMEDTNSKMAKLKNPPSKYKDQYDILIKAYNDLNEYVSLANNPSGSLISFGNDISRLSTDISKTLKEYDIKKN